MTLKDLINILAYPVDVVLVDINGLPAKVNSLDFTDKDGELLESPVELVSILDKKEIYVKLEE